MLCLCASFNSCQKNAAEKINPPAQNKPNTLKAGATDTTYKLVWSDEFNYTGLPNTAYWNYEVGYIRNNETQYYEKKRLTNSSVANGVLTITALNDNYNGAPVTSASVITKNKEIFLYGRMEVIAKMPTGKGSWPAIWMLGTDRGTVHWPDCGEVDIMEWLGRVPSEIFGSIYTVANALGIPTSKITPYTPSDTANLSGEFHVYAIDWDSTQIQYFYDNVNYATYKASSLTASQWAPFKQPMYLLLNLAMGGTSGGTIDNTKYPFVYQIDYVRYYQKVK